MQRANPMNIGWPISSRPLKLPKNPVDTIRWTKFMINRQIWRTLISKKDIFVLIKRKGFFFVVVSCIGKESC